MAFTKIKNSGADKLPEEFICESTDEKPTEDIPIGSTAWELDTKTGFVFDGSTWREV